MLIDTHAHLDSKRFSRDLPEVISRAVEAGVETIVAIGCDVASSRRAVEIATEFPNVFATVGIHPCYILDVAEQDWLERIAGLAAHPKVVAIGEIGLDYYHEPKGATWEEYKTRQAEFFLRQMELAADIGKNIVVHQRNSFTDSVAMVAAFAGQLRAQFHCFINSWSDAQTLTEQGHLVSFTGIATYPKAPEVLECAAQASSGSFMLETDAPYLTPQRFRGSRCEPAHVRETAAVIAAARGVSLETLAAQTTATAREFFSLP